MDIATIPREQTVPVSTGVSHPLELEEGLSRKEEIRGAVRVVVDDGLEQATGTLGGAADVGPLRRIVIAGSPVLLRDHNVRPFWRRLAR